MRPQGRKKLFFDDSDHTSIVNNRKSKIPADSPEVLYLLYCDKIISLQTQLNKLTLLDHPCEIQSVCGQIIQLKMRLDELASKYKMPKDIYL